jgi:hypothetical protein
LRPDWRSGERAEQNDADEATCSFHIQFLFCLAI